MTVVTRARSRLIDVDLRGLVTDTPDLAEMTAELERRYGDWRELEDELERVASRRESLSRDLRRVETEAERRDARRELRSLTDGASDLPESIAVAADEFGRALDRWSAHLIREADAVYLAASSDENMITQKLPTPLAEGQARGRRREMIDRILDAAAPAQERQARAQRLKRELLLKRRAVGLRNGKPGLRRWVAVQRERAAEVVR